jgi:hypothetical protein
MNQAANKNESQSSARSDGWNFNMAEAPRPPMNVDGGIVVWDGDNQYIVRWNVYGKGWQVGRTTEGDPLYIQRPALAWRHMFKSPIVNQENSVQV